jgi:hypothetical protein
MRVYVPVSLIRGYFAEGITWINIFKNHIIMIIKQVLLYYTESGTENIQM